MTVPSPRPPADHLGKVARRITVGIYLDETLAETYDRAVASLERARARWVTDHARALHDGKARRGLGDPTITLSGDAAIDALEAAYADADLARDRALAPLEAAVDEALAALDAGTRWFTFRSLGRRAYAALIAEHPAGDADHEAARRETGDPEAKAPWNGETFCPALIRASCVDPVLSAEEVEDIVDGDTWTQQDLLQLFSAALAVNSQTRVVSHRDTPKA